MARKSRSGGGGIPCYSTSCPSRPPFPPRAMGCAASGDRAERRGRGRALGHGEASTTGVLVERQNNGQEAVSAAAAGRRRGCKVAPEPKEEEEDTAAALAMPGSPSFRIYCQKSAAVDALVADADGVDNDGPIRITETTQTIKRNDLVVHGSNEFSKSEEASRWLKFRGLAVVVAAVCSLFSRHSSATPAPPHPPAAKSHHRCASPAPAADATAAAAARAHP
ncbi:hypothetical protein GUJ93_ZPchr0007g5010 [Zizania palustris]|uniref:Uncharacterized protein n=1 Tax=Zizania palustris TaxID=103762 RepID=A0A8J5TJ22_ZIZPA|nr:hypothetical protein GUJ93_ZPchr0007g5010 [Zizania palustris]